MKKFISELKQELLKKSIFITRLLLVLIFGAMIIIIIISLFHINGIDKVYEISKICHIGDKKYEIIMRSNGYYECKNCTKKMKRDIIFMANWQKLYGSSHEIEEYFIQHNGNCDY